MAIVLFLASLSILLAFLQSAVSQDTPLRAIRRAQDSGSSATGTMKVTGEGRALLQVAVADLELTRGADSDLQLQYDKTIRYDLEFTDYYSPILNTPEMVAQHRTDHQMRAIDYTAWQGLRADFLVKGEFDGGGNSGTVRMFAYDVNAEQSMLALEYPISFDSQERKVREARRAVHNFVDQLVAKYDDDKIGGCASSYIAFENARWQSDSKGNKKKVREIFIMDYDGRNVRQITQDRDLCLSPSWSPDGRKLVYTSYRQSNPDLYVYNLDSGKITVLSAFPGLNGAASWNPDGRSLAITLSKDGNPEIYKINADGSGATRLTRSRHVETSATWTPDGGALYFLSDRFGPPQILKMSSSGGSPQTIVRGGNSDDPSVSPRGDAITYTSSQGGGGFNVWVADMGGGGARNLTGELSGNCEHPSWAPDGRHIVFGHNGQIVVMDADGTDKRYITSPDRIPGENASPSWGP